MEIKEGMYVRTTYGRIYKIEKIKTTKVYYSCNPPELQWQDREFVYSKSGVECEDAILKASHNIIDLIEEGDYVDGYLINNKNDNGVYHGAWDCYDEAHFTKPEDVHTIVTKEQFAAMAYEVKHD